LHRLSASGKNHAFLLKPLPTSPQIDFKESYQTVKEGAMIGRCLPYSLSDHVPMIFFGGVIANRPGSKRDHPNIACLLHTLRADEMIILQTDALLSTGAFEEVYGMQKLR
jgi:hypothetical protein